MSKSLKLAWTNRIKQLFSIKDETMQTVTIRA
uniref:Uncharacterized protein n=1 Tax=Arundo donax TaxID=35708 RepID=A0A0A9ABN0_ARUDO